MTDHTVTGPWDPDDPALQSYSSADPGRQDPFVPPKRRTAWTADQLMAEVFPEPRWAIPGLVCEGLTIVVGSPKAGKSWALLGIAAAVACGGKVFGKIPVKEGDVLYLALEDNGPRLQRRLKQVLDGASASHRLTIATECPPLDQGGAELIENWISRNPDARLVIIDVFAKIRPIPRPGTNAYEADYAAIGKVKRIADEHGVAVVAIHHTRKAAADDFLAEVSGTNGIAGAADATIAIKRPRNKAEAVLSITGRDVEEAEHDMHFDAVTGKWTMRDKAPSNPGPPNNTEIVTAWLKEHPDSGHKEIAEGTGIPLNTVKSVFVRDKGEFFVKTGHGKYRVVEHGDEAEHIWSDSL